MNTVVRSRSSLNVGSNPPLMSKAYVTTFSRCARDIQRYICSTLGDGTRVPHFEFMDQLIGKQLTVRRSICVDKKYIKLVHIHVQNNMAESELIQFYLILYPRNFAETIPNLKPCDLLENFIPRPSQGIVQLCRHTQPVILRWTIIWYCPSQLRHIR